MGTSCNHRNLHSSFFLLLSSVQHICLFLSILGIEGHCKNVFIPYWMLKYVDSCTLSHINSVSREPLGNKMPYEALTFFYGEEMLKKPHEIKIEKDDVTLMLHLLKSQNTAK